MRRVSATSLVDESGNESQLPRTVTRSAPVQSGRSFPHRSRSWKQIKLVIKADPGVPMAAVFRSQKRSRSAGRREECGRGVEDETEYETVNRRSALLILLFDLRLGSTQAAWGYCTCPSALIHTRCVQTHMWPHRNTYSMQYSHPFSLLHAHHQSPHIKSQFEPWFLCLKCSFFECLRQERGIFM